VATGRGLISSFLDGELARRWPLAEQPFASLLPGIRQPAWTWWTIAFETVALIRSDEDVALLLDESAQVRLCIGGCGRAERR
jgi:hypothetical protein